MVRAPLIFLPLIGCAAVPVPPAVLTGDWGGTHVGLHLTPSGGTLEYDCAHGTIGPIVVDGSGRFTAEGTHTAEHGGPVREGEVLPSSPVRYSGSIAGDRMILEGRLDNGVELGSFELRRGAEPRILRCL